MKDPTHPGEIIREEVIRPLGLSVTAADSALGVNRQALSAFLNQRSDLLPEMALRIEVALGPKAEVMMGIQTDYDIARASPRSGPRSTGSKRRPPDSTRRRGRAQPEPCAHSRWTGARFTFIMLGRYGVAAATSRLGAGPGRDQ